MADIDEFKYVSKNYSKKRLQDWIYANEPWRILDTKEEEKVSQDESESQKTLSKQEIWDLNKTEQVELINLYDVSEIPRYEKDRVELILNLQLEKLN